MLSEKFLISENTMISCVREIAHINLLGCVPAHARVIVRVSGNSMWIFRVIYKNVEKKNFHFITNISILYGS